MLRVSNDANVYGGTIIQTADCDFRVNKQSYFNRFLTK